jgi:WD40 repeat protein
MHSIQAGRDAWFAGRDLTIHNEFYGTQQPEGSVYLDLLTQQRELRLADLRGHFEPRARGVDAPTEAGWRFVGREAALLDLVGWLNDTEDRSTRIVTGGPGSGKSAVIGRLVVLSDPGYRRTVPIEGLGRDMSPPEGCIATGVHARGLTSAQVLAALCVQAGVIADTPTRLLRGMRGQRLTVAIDAVDEALDPVGLASGVLRPLVEAGPGAGLRLLIGTRPHLIGSLGLTGSSAVINLDSERYADPESIYQYVLRGLRDAEDSPYASATPGLIGAVAQAVADAAGHSFLVARIVTRTLLSQPQVPDPADHTWRASLPGTAAAAMHADLETRLGGEAERARDLLRPLAFAAGAGLPWSLWAPLASKLSGHSYTNEDLTWLWDQAGSYVVEFVESGPAVYRLYHSALAEYLRQDQVEADVHGAFASFLISQVRGTHGPDWSHANPYTLAHLITHARQAGLLDDLLRDPGFLVNAAPAGLLAALPAARAQAAERAGVAYQRAVHQFRNQPEDQRASYLGFAARIARAPELADRIDDRFPERRWSIPWTHWPREYPHRVLGGHLGAVTGVLVVDAAEGKPVVVSVGADGRLRTWDLATAEPTGDYRLGTVPLIAAKAVRLAEHRAVIVILSSDGMLHLWDLATATLLRTVRLIPAWRHRLSPFMPLDLRLECLTVPGERHFAFVGGLESGASIWELPTLRPVAFLPSPAGPTKIDYLETTGGRVVLVAEMGARGHWIFDVQDMRELPVDSGYGRRSMLRSARKTLGGRTRVRFYASSHGEPAVAVQYARRRAVVWDLAVSRRLGTWPVSMPGVSARLADGTDVTIPLRLDRNEPDLAGSGLWELGSVRTSRTSPDGVPGFDATLDGRFLRVGFSVPGTIRTRSILLAGHTGAVADYDAVAVSDGLVVVTASMDGTVRRWEIDRNKPWQDTDDDGMPNRAVDHIVSVGLDDGASLGLGCDVDGDVALWDLRTGEFIRDLHLARAYAIDAVHMASEPVAVVAGIDGAIQVARIADGEVRRFPGDRLRSPSAIVGVTLPDGSDVAVTTGHGRKAVVWDLGTGRMDKVLDAHRGWSSCVSRAQEVGTQPLVLTGGLDNRVNLWEVSRGRHRQFRIVQPWTFLAHPLTGHARAISTVPLPNGGVLVLVTTSDGMVRVLETRDTMRRARRRGAITADVVTSTTLTSGLLVVITAADGIVRVWDAAAFPPPPGSAPLCEINIEVPVTDITATDHDVVVLATPNGLTAIRLGAGSLTGHAVKPLTL